MPAPSEGEARADAADRVLGLESRQPGQNVFAQRQVARHRHLLQSNAFYQAAFLEKRNLPPDVIHPAFRTPGLSLDTSLPIPSMPMPGEIHAAQQGHQELSGAPMPHFRNITGQTSSPFDNNGQQAAPPQVHVDQQMSSPFVDTAQQKLSYAFIPGQQIEPHPVDSGQQKSYRSTNPDREVLIPPVDHSQPMIMPPNLYTTPVLPSVPTMRAVLEDNAEQRRYEMYNGEEQRVPVYYPAPSSPLGHKVPKAEVKFADFNTTVTPKKKTGFLGLFRLGGKRNSDVLNTVEQGQRLPVKPEAVLGAKQTGTPVRRSSSKKRFLFRRSSDSRPNSPPLVNDPQRPSTSAGLTRRLSRSNSHPSRGDMSRVSPVKGKANAGNKLFSSITRSKSLKYIDSFLPPTPPMKDTPPGMKATHIIDQDDKAFIAIPKETPSEPAPFLSARPSPSGNHPDLFPRGRSQELKARLVTQPSMHSLHASVDTSKFPPEVKKELQHMDALGLAGWNEEQYSNQEAYSPSMYSQANTPDVLRKSFGHFPRPQTIHEQEEEEQEEIHVEMTMKPQHMVVNRQVSLRESVETRDTTCTSGTIHVYRDLEGDQSISEIMNSDDAYLSSMSTMAQATRPSDHHKHADDVFATPRAHHQPGNAKYKHSTTTSGEYTDSPMSPMSRHSAEVAPLRPHGTHASILPAAVFTPQSKHARRQTMNDGNINENASARYQQILETPTTTRAKGKGLTNEIVLSPAGMGSPGSRIPSQPTKVDVVQNVQSGTEAIQGSPNERQESKKGKKKRISSSFAQMWYRSPQVEATKTPAAEASTKMQTAQGSDMSPKFRAASLRGALKASIAEPHLISTEPADPIASPSTLHTEQQMMKDLIQRNNALMSQMMGRMERLETEFVSLRRASGHQPPASERPGWI